MTTRYIPSPRMVDAVILFSPDGQFKVEVISTLDSGQTITVSQWARYAKGWIIREQGIRPPKYGVSDQIRASYVATAIGRYVDPTTLVER